MANDFTDFFLKLCASYFVVYLLWVLFHDRREARCQKAHSERVVRK